MVLRGLHSFSLLEATQTPSPYDNANYPLILDAVLYTVRMYALNNDEHTYERSSCIQLTGFYVFGVLETAPHCVRR